MGYGNRLKPQQTEETSSYGASHPPFHLSNAVESGRSVHTAGRCGHAAVFTIRSMDRKRQRGHRDRPPVLEQSLKIRVRLKVFDFPRLA